MLTDGSEGDRPRRQEVYTPPPATRLGRYIQGVKRRARWRAARPKVIARRWRRLNEEERRHRVEERVREGGPHFDLVAMGKFLGRKCVLYRWGTRLLYDPRQTWGYVLLGFSLPRLTTHVID